MKLPRPQRPTKVFTRSLVNFTLLHHPPRGFPSWSHGNRRSLKILLH